MFHASRSFPSPCGAACFVILVRLRSFAASLPALLDPLLVPLGLPEPGRAILPALRAAVLRPSLAICCLSFHALPKGFPASSALQTSCGECCLPALPAHLLFLLFSLFFPLFFPPFFSQPYGVTVPDFWWVTGSTREVYLMMMISLCIWCAVYCRSARNADCCYWVLGFSNVKVHRAQVKSRWLAEHAYKLQWFWGCKGLAQHSVFGQDVKSGNLD